MYDDFQVMRDGISEMNAQDIYGLLCPRHKMGEGHIEFTLSMCVSMCICVFFHFYVCVF